MSKGTTNRNIRVEDELWDSAQETAAENGETVSGAVRDFLAVYTRKSSTYTLRLPDLASADRVAAYLPQVSDFGGNAAVSFRASGDEAAIQIATDALAATGETRPALLTTGLGIHRRTVAEQD